MDPKLEGKLVVAISSRALFDLDDAHRLFEEKGLEAYREFQIAREEDRLPHGTGFSLVRGLLSVNERAGRELVEVVLVSRNDADTGLRVMNSVEQYGLPISRAVFTDGREPYAYLEPFSCHLFLSANNADVACALEAGFAAGRVYQPPLSMDANEHELRIAFDGDAVLFSPDAEEVFRKKGLDEFHKQEQESAEIPLNPGPFKGFLEQLHRLQGLFPADACPIRTALVTARSAPAHKRAIKTLRKWNVRVNEAFFLGGVQKDGVLAKFRPHIFFDDQSSYCDRAAQRTPTAQVAARDPGEQASIPNEKASKASHRARRTRRRASRASDARPSRSKGGH
jgi:5'-nucleotidase